MAMNVFQELVPFSSIAFRLRMKLAMIELIRSILLLSSITIVFVIVCSVCTDQSPLDLLNKLLNVALSKQHFTDAVEAAIPLCLMAFAFSVPYLVGFINLGAEGQVSLGALMASAVTITASKYNINPLVNILSSLFVAALVAVAWSAISVLLKLYLNVNEIVTTFILNALALSVISILLTSKRLIWYNGDSQGLESISFQSQISSKPYSLHLQLTLIVIVFLIALTVTHAFIWWSSFGLRIRAVGGGFKTALLCGINNRSSVFIAVSIAAVAAGIAGLDVLFRTGRFQADDFSGWGFEGITIAILGRHKLLGIMLASVYMAVLKQFALSIQGYGISYGSFLILQAVCVFLYLFADRRKKV